MYGSLRVDVPRGDPRPPYLCHNKELTNLLANLSSLSTDMRQLVRVVGAVQSAVTHPPLVDTGKTVFAADMGQRLASRRGGVIEGEEGTNSAR